MKKQTEFERLREILVWYQDEYETNKSNIWVEECSKCRDKIENLTNQLCTELHDYCYAFQNLGFVQGMKYALDIMNVAGKGENKEIIEKFLKNIEIHSEEETGEK